jgi:hypothetical protein
MIDLRAYRAPFVSSAVYNRCFSVGMIALAMHSGELLYEFETPFLDAVAHVVAICAEKKVRGIDAITNVAVVTNK